MLLLGVTWKDGERSSWKGHRPFNEPPPAGLNDQLVQKMVNQGLNTFYAEASANAKLDLAPLIEQMQRNLQSLR